MKGKVQIKVGKCCTFHRTIVEIRTGVYDGGAEVSLLPSEFFVEIGEQVVKTINVAEFEIAAESFLERLDIRVQIASPMAPEYSLLEREVSGLTKQAGHDRWLGTSVADHDERRGLEKRKQDSHQLRIELRDFFRQIPVRILLRFPVQPYDLGPVEDVKFPEIVRTAIHLRDVTDVWPLVV